MKEAAKESNSVFQKLSNPEMESILELSDDILIHELTKVENEKTRKLVDDYLNRIFYYSFTKLI